MRRISMLLLLASWLSANNNLVLKYELLHAMKTDNILEVQNLLTSLQANKTDISTMYYNYVSVYSSTPKLNAVFLENGLDPYITKHETPLIYVLLKSGASCLTLTQLFDAGVSKHFVQNSPYVFKNREKTDTQIKYFTASIYTKAVEYDRCVELFDAIDLSNEEKSLGMLYAIKNQNIKEIRRIIGLGINLNTPVSILKTQASTYLKQARNHPKIIDILVTAGAKK